MLQAFLHRVVNGKGRIEREYALGSRRVDLLLVWPGGEAPPGRFVVFDMREGRTWAEKIHREARRRNGTTVTVWGA